MYRILDEYIVESELSEGEIIILSLSTGEYLGLNDIAVDIWNYLRKYGDVLMIVEKLQLEYTIDTETLMKDVKEFIYELCVAGVVEEIARS